MKLAELDEQLGRGMTQRQALLAVDVDVSGPPDRLMFTVGDLLRLGGP